MITLKVIELVSRHTSVQYKKIQLIHNMVIDLGMDSLDSMELLFTLEEEFDMELPRNFDPVRTCNTVQDLVSYVQQLV